MTDRGKIAFVAAALRHSARHWFHDLIIDDPLQDGNQPHPDDTRISTYDAFRVAFVTRFKKDTNNAWRDVNKMFATKQMQFQMTEQYITQMQDMARQAGADSDQLRFAILAGLRDSVKAQVLHVSCRM